MRRELIWPVTIVASVVVIGIVVLSALGKDVSALVAFAGTALGVFMLGQVKEQTNGGISRLHSLVERLTDQLASSTPVLPQDLNPTSGPPSRQGSDGS